MEAVWSGREEDNEVEKEGVLGSSPVEVKRKLNPLTEAEEGESKRRRKKGKMKR